MSKYTLVPLDEQLLQRTRRTWEGLLDEDAFEMELASSFEWAASHMSSVEGDSVAMGMQNTDSDRIDAIVEIVSSRKGQMHKMLKVITSPFFWDVTSRREEIVQLYIDVFFNVISSHGFRSSHKVKIYGRDDEMMSLLRSIHSMWKIPSSSAEFEGRFLAISWS